MDLTKIYIYGSDAKQYVWQKDRDMNMEHPIQMVEHDRGSVDGVCQCRDLEM